MDQSFHVAMIFHLKIHWLIAIEIFGTLIFDKSLKDSQISGNRFEDINRFRNRFQAFYTK